MKVSEKNPCPCGSQKNYETCCLRFHEEKSLPETAVELMRSRYCAYVAGRIDYVEKTNDPSAKDTFDREAATEWANSSEWLGLEIVATKEGLKGDETGEVEFKAKYKRGQEDFVHHEVSLFKRISGRWYYVDGKELRAPERRTSPKIGRNDPCTCGSGKKFKKCCG